MIYIEPSVELIDEKDNFKRIERAGRVSYKSEDKITEDSAYPFFQRICKRGHTSVIEHSVLFVVTHNPETTAWLRYLLEEYSSGAGHPHYIRYSPWVTSDCDTYLPVHRDLDIPLGVVVGNEYLFSGNLRAWRNVAERYKNEQLLSFLFKEHSVFTDIFEKADMCASGIYTHDDVEIVDSIPTDPDEYEFAYLHNIATMHIIADRGVIDEYARHRVFAHTIESTRYVNYEDKGITFVFPFWFKDVKNDPKIGSVGGTFGNTCYSAEVAYHEIMNKTNTPQIARGALPLWVKSEHMMTGTIQQWIDLLKLRDSPAAHPDAQKIAKMIERVLVEEVWVKDIWGVKNND